MELKAKLVSRWAASFLDCLKSCTNPEESKKKEGIEKREREREREEADELGLMELKAKLIPLWPSKLAPTPKKARKDMV